MLRAAGMCISMLMCMCMQDSYRRRLIKAPAQVLDFAQVDSWRAQRTGFPEVVLGAGKSAEQIAAIMRQLAQNEQVVMATRVSPEACHCPILNAPCS